MGSRILKAFISVIGAKAATLVLGLIITPLMVRFLGSKLYGDYAFLMSLLGITMIIVNSGIFDGMRKYIAEDRSPSHWKEHVFGFYLSIGLMFAIAAASFYVFISWLGVSKDLLGSGYESYLYVLALVIIARQLNSISRGGLMGLGVESRSEPLVVVKKIAFGTVGLTLAYLGYGIIGLFIGHIFASLLFVSLSFSILAKNLDFRKISPPWAEDFPSYELISYNTWSVILILLLTSLYHIDILLLRPIAGSEATGYYRAALVLAEFLWFAPIALQTVFLHSTSKLWSKGENDEITQLASNATRYNLLITVLLAIGLAVLARDFVPLYFGPGFEQAVLPLIVLLPGAIGFGLARPILAIGQGKGDLWTLIKVTALAAFLNLVLNLLFIPRYGIIGAALATSLSYGSMFLLHIFAARRIGFNPVQEIRAFRILLAAFITGLLLYPMSFFIESPFISIIIVPPAGFIIYGLACLRLGTITRKELSDIAIELPEPMSTFLTKYFRKYL